MSDRYAGFASTRPGRSVVHRLGLPEPTTLRRYRPGHPEIDGVVLLGGHGRLVEPVRRLLDRLGAAVVTPDGDPPPLDIRQALVYDATGITDAVALHDLHAFFQPSVRSLRPCGRVVVLGTPPARCPEPREAIAQRALEGFVRSLAKEVGRGTTAQLVHAEPGVTDGIESTLRFLLSPKSAYVSGQVIRVGAPAGAAAATEAATTGGPAPDARAVDWHHPLAGRVAVVTGAARGIGAAIAGVLARDGAHVVCLDVPSAGEPLAGVANDIAGSALQLDLAAADAPERLTTYLRDRHGRADIVVHNAGITRDRTLARMPAEQFDAVIRVNLAAPQRVTDALLAAGLVGDGGRIIAVSSVTGIAGNRGQTNYAASKAGLIGLVEALAPALTGRGITVNAVAPGFIETRMTETMPVMVREAGRRLNSASQGGLPVDVAETIAWLANPASAGITGQVVRVCGQSLLGA